MVEAQKAAKRLADKKAELEELSRLSADSRKPVALDQQSVGRLSRMDAMQQQAMENATEAKRVNDLMRVEAAQRRLRDGDYGYCDECGEEIADGRLAVDPMAITCIKCAR